MSGGTNGKTEPMEYAGDVKFCRPEGGDIQPVEPLETWIENARKDFLRSRLVLPIINSTDDQLERIIREGPLPYWYDLMEDLASAQQRWEAGTDIYKAATGRLIIVLERIQGPEAIAAAYAEDKDE